MSIYQDIYDAQRSQGFMGGKKGQSYGGYKNGEKVKQKKDVRNYYFLTFSVEIISAYY